MGAPFAHIEIPVDNFEKAKEFYGKLFQWEFQCDTEPTEYVTFDPGEGPGGGFWIPENEEQKHITNYIHVPDIEKILEEIKTAGGKVYVEKTAIGEHGFFAIFGDPFDNVMGLWEPVEE